MTKKTRPLKQKAVLELLQKASQPKTGRVQLRRIEQALVASMKVKTDISHLGERFEGRLEALEDVITNLFRHTCQHRRSWLPSLLPAFAMLCGSKRTFSRTGYLDTVDWDLVDSLHRRKKIHAQTQVKPGRLARKRANLKQRRGPVNQSPSTAHTVIG